MSSTLAALQKLQAVETQLAELRNRLASKKRRVDAQKARLAKLDEDLGAEARELRNRQIEIDRFDLDLKSKEAEIAKLRTSLNSSRTNKEYAAVLSQLNTVKVDSGKIEEKLVALMTQFDEYKKNSGQGGERRAAEERKLAELEEEHRAAEAASRDRLADLSRRRTEAAAGVPAAALGLFERIASKNDGHALSMVIRTNPKREEFACESCNMSVTLQQVNALLSRDEPVICHTCGHILYLEAHAVST